ncbi:MAG: thiamine pyrophosphate-dependent dehydrogenase E1 component subunit alpha [Variibacter sp.]|nr:thiamine pyrophosphate-dependent dehydrogenase E1 component subunit alpha [Variibacter sp.]
MVTAEEALKLYGLMWEVRAFETAACDGYKQGEMPGFIHVSLGQEGCSAGACGALEREDLITSTHRGHGHCLAKGADPKRMMAELFAKEQGYGKGRAGSMHIADVSVGVLGATGIVGQSLGLGVGAALSLQVRGRPNCVVAFFGEGASGAGIAHEAMNMAALWRLPIVFFCEVNRYAELSPYAVHVPIERVADRAAAYGFPGATVDGEDVLAVYEAVRAAAVRARAGEGPTLVEAKSYRWHGHYEGDPQRYKTAQELQSGRSFDPIRRFERDAAGLGISENALAVVREQAEATIAAAVAWASGMQSPPASAMTEDVYAGAAS